MAGRKKAFGLSLWLQGKNQVFKLVKREERGESRERL
jgi:hypothetical protein